MSDAPYHDGAHMLFAVDAVVLDIHGRVRQGGFPQFLGVVHIIHSAGLG